MHTSAGVYQWQDGSVVSSPSANTILWKSNRLGTGDCLAYTQRLSGPPWQSDTYIHYADCTVSHGYFCELEGNFVEEKEKEMTYVILFSQPKTAVT